MIYLGIALLVVGVLFLAGMCWYICNDFDLPSTYTGNLFVVLYALATFALPCIGVFLIASHQ